MTTVSVVIPVKNGVRYLQEVLEAVLSERPDEVLVVDSGSTDGSLEIAAAAGVATLAIDPLSFRHGQTRNLAAERTGGELICFLTQDATPVPGWLEGYRQAFARDPRVGAGFGPHLARPDTSPMIARELEEFFASFGSGELPVLQARTSNSFLSNANACYRRACWEQIRFRDVLYAEDYAFARDMLTTDWLRVYVPRGAVLHAHDYPPLTFMRRYFDEYRGLRQSAGHVEALHPLFSARWIVGNARRDLRWLRRNGASDGELGRWLGRSLVHHSGRRLFSVLGSHAAALPVSLQQRISLEGVGLDRATLRAADATRMLNIPPLPAPVHREALSESFEYGTAAEVRRDGPVPLLPAPAGISQRRRLEIAMLVPPFDRGSGGHNTLFQLLSRLEERGDICSVWMIDWMGRIGNRRGSVIRRDIREWFAPIEGPVYNGLTDWHGADVVLATGWQTVHPALRLPDTVARVYLVNDHEPDFYDASSEREIAADSYRYGLHCIAASPWLADLLVERYGASADHFHLGVDHQTYQVRPVARRRDTVVFYARHATGRRAVPHGLLALEELHRRRPEVRIVLFGSAHPVPTTFPYEDMGVLSPEQLSWLYSEATVGLCLSLTNFSLMPQEMLACGLPCVELAGISAESMFGADGALELVPLDPSAQADALERLLDDTQLWERRSAEGIAAVADRDWERATDEVEAGIRHALALREGTRATSTMAE